jgi:hypothetical protein
MQALERLAASSGATVHSPLYDVSFIAALAAAGGRLGAGDRAATIERWLAAALPRAIAARQTKALFDEVFWRAHSRAQVHDWDGGGIDSSLVDPETLRATWNAERPNSRSALLLQSVWLAQSPPGSTCRAR